MASIKLDDLYLSKNELKDVMQLVAKKRNIKNYKSKSNDKSHKIFKEIRKNLYNIARRKKINSKNTNKYIDEINKKILKLEKIMITMIMNIKE